MGLMDKIAGAFKGTDQTPPKPEAKKKLPPALPGQREALVKDERGFVTTLRADMKLVKVSEVKKYAADRRAALVMESQDLNKSGLPLSDREKGLNRITAELKKLDAIEAKADEAAAAGREGAYEGREPLVENPLYQEKAEEVGEADIQVDEKATALANLEKQRAEVVSLEARKADLQKQIKQMLNKVKGEVAAEDVATYIADTAEAGMEKPQFPNYFPTDIEAANRDEQYVGEHRVEASYARDKRRNMAEPLRNLLDEMDDINEKLNSLNRNIQAAESRYGKDKAA